MPLPDQTFLSSLFVSTNVVHFQSLFNANTDILSTDKKKSEKFMYIDYD